MGRTGELWRRERGKRVWTSMCGQQELSPQAPGMVERWTPNISVPA